MLFDLLKWEENPSPGYGVWFRKLYPRSLITETISTNKNLYAYTYMNYGAFVDSTTSKAL